MTNGHGPSLVNGSAPTSLISGPIPAQPFPPTSQTPVSFTAEQISALRAQIYAFKLSLAVNLFPNISNKPFGSPTML